MSSIRGVNVGGNLFDVTDSSNVAPIETTNFASRAYAKDRCFIMADGLLYRATAEIESGDPIVINGNCKRTTLDEIISVIKTDNDLIAPTEDGATSSDDYAVGDEIVRSGILYKVISAIAEGDAFVIGNNIDIAGSLTSQIQTLTNNDDAMLNVLGAKNLLPNYAVTQTINGVTFTVNSDGTVTANGTATPGTAVLTLCDITLNANDEFILSGGGASNCFMEIYYKQDYTLYERTDDNAPNGLAITIPQTGVYEIRCIVPNNATANNFVFKPMLRPTSIADDTYVPYAMTNAELTESVVPKDCSSYFSSSIIEQVNYAVVIGKIVLFSFMANGVSISANSQLVNSIITNDAIKPKAITSVCVSPGNLREPTDVMGFIRANGELVLRSASTVTSQAYVISGVYLIS